MTMIKCPICGTAIQDDDYTECPYCGWGYVGIEKEMDPNEREDYNLMSIVEAKRLVESGKNIWGEPLPKKAVR